MFFVWVYFGLIAVLNSIGLVLSRQSQLRDVSLGIIHFVFPATLITFAFVGALIASRQPHNRIGLLLLLPGSSFAPLTDGIIEMFLNGFWTVPAQPTPLFLLFVWFSSWNWVLLIFPLLYLLLLFPTGRLLSPRWRWLLYSITVLMLLIPFLGTFGEEVTSPTYDAWAFANPIGFIELESFTKNILPFFAVLLPLCVFFCVIALFVRFRQARGVEREQIKWLFLAGSIFAMTYIPAFIDESFTKNTIWNNVWMLGMMTVPVAIGIAILRYRLFDIEVIIRKTVQYGLVTAVLALVYFGTIILLQNLVGRATGEQSPIIIVLSTLLIAALFNPLRQRVQAFVDRRFYRQKYDAQQVLAQFAQTARDEVDRDALAVELSLIIQKTIQPESMGMWLKEGHSEG